MKKKILSLLLALALVLPLCPVTQYSSLSIPVFAEEGEHDHILALDEEGGEGTDPDSLLKVEVSPEAIAQGENFTVTITLNETVNTQGFGFDWTQAYDHSLFEWVSGSWSEDIKSAALLAVTQPGGYAAFVGENAFDVSGEIFTFVLKPIDVVDCSKTYEITVTPSTLLDVPAASTTLSLKHTFDNACDTTCNYCDYTRTITHDYSVQDKSATEHWMKCSVCGTIDETTRETHGYDNACDTTCDECGYVREITHDYSVQDKSATEHWMKCSVCGTIDETTREAHGYDNNCDTTCDECGYVREITHDYSVQEKNETEHWMKCSVCGAIDETSREAHGYDNDKDPDCDECGHVRYIIGDVDASGAVDLDDAVYLLYHVNFHEAYAVNQPVDFDGNGVVDLDDAIYLLYHINFPTAFPLR